MRKHFIMALAALGFAACSESVDDPNASINKGDLEESYIAINLMAADANTRAVTDDIGKADEYDYEDGIDAERAINSAYFFFFDENGNPFNVTGAPATAPDYTNGGKNHLSLAITSTPEGTSENISDISNAVLVLNTYKGVYPSKIVAVINWTPANQAYSLEELHTILGNIRGVGNGFVMSNSVYMDGAGNIVDAVPLTTANIKTTAAEAQANPVEIYVERTAAKVVLTASGKVDGTSNIFATGKTSTPNITLGEATAKDVYVQLHGWELYNDYNTSNLLKNIQNWDVATLGLTWNDIPYYRCYWAESQATNPEDKFSWSYENHTEKGFPTANGFKVAETANYTIGTFTYCGENTNGENYRTKVILKGQLMQQNDNGTYSALELARWYGTEYAGNAALRTAVANSLKYTLYYKEGDKYFGITPEDLQCVEGNIVGAETYEVGFQLSSTPGDGKGTEKEWFKYDSENNYVSFGAMDTEGVNAQETNKYLKSVEPALLYAEGQTYYYIDIEHLGTAGAKYGVVRNHVYQIDIESIGGYGSPIYIGTSNIVTPPEYPEDEEESSYVAARINVLSWKIVKQSVNIEP